MQEKTGTEGKSEGLLHLPDAPAEQHRYAVRAWQEPVVMRSYMPDLPDVNPLFLEKRVYQGSSGRVYPLPVIDHVAVEPVQHQWQAVHIENESIRVMILPEIGGRIHIGLDKRNGYDFFYRQNVIKPALVGLAGPWASGGVEFNWPQHHRPATFMPVDIDIERHSDGSVTVWCSDVDRMSGLKGMHGVCLHPGKSYLELKARLYNPTPLTQTFLWWANVATRVHEHYQSFFPPDAKYVADHAKRAISKFPLCEGTYYGIDYAGRAKDGVPAEEMPRHHIPDGSYAANDLSWYANIPVPTSYMVLGSEGDFVGGYDHAARAGLVHYANHHIAPGKKQWTWGNHDFGYLWDRNLTDNDGPYIELMAGVYTDNQPDFSFLASGETKTFSQFWYPIREIGPPVQASCDAALSIAVKDGVARFGISVTSDRPAASVKVKAGGQTLYSAEQDLTVGHPFFFVERLPRSVSMEDLDVSIYQGAQRLLHYAHQPAGYVEAVEPAPAVEPPLPADVSSADQLFLIGMHLEQYRHATRRPEDYWRECLRRDANDARASHAMGRWHLQRGELVQAKVHLERSIARLTELNPNPYDGEPYYTLGLVCRYLGEEDAAYKAFYKATWNAAWRGPGYHALSQIDASRGDWTLAVEHARVSLRMNADDLNLRNLLAVALERTGNSVEAEQVLGETRTLDRLDSWSLFLAEGIVPADGYKRLALASDLMRCALFAEAIIVLTASSSEALDGSNPIALYTLAHCYRTVGDVSLAASCSAKAQSADPRYCFPSTLQEMLILEQAATAGDGMASYYLGNLLYDRRRHQEAIAAWEQALKLGVSFATVWRNLGVAYFNVQGDGKRSREAYERALAANPADARIFYERDQLWKRIGVDPVLRLKELLNRPDLTARRNDLSVELATLFNQAGRSSEALDLLTSRPFQAWEGGEGLVLDQYIRANLVLGQDALVQSDPRIAVERFSAALHTPENLGEARHLLVNQSEIYYWLGMAFHMAGENGQARDWWQRAARQTGDFQQMSVRSVSTATLWTGLSLAMLGEEAAAQDLMRNIFDFAEELHSTLPAIDYFATSLPTMLLFEEDLGQRNKIEATFLEAQARFGMRNFAEAGRLLQIVQSLDINHVAAQNLSRLVQQSAASTRGR
ncbi:tetratricopeptide (TPR) repeat protein [Granulicella aggregans]|uniref:Tetratricopeptide (TPR) repeat protein n=1 Tax=Granulicella aggregans TaxID=474949 RepID=A0A7W7ZE57_9BACT|nr:DUF5107 domain-containing protein [Granulicella aggregans]MBB5058093.1 tetratricopeptide (TPR) repeat protein [Granulicella aggregans]